MYIYIYTHILISWNFLCLMFDGLPKPFFSPQPRFAGRLADYKLPAAPCLLPDSSTTWKFPDGSVTSRPWHCSWKTTTSKHPWSCWWRTRPPAGEPGGSCWGWMIWSRVHTHTKRWICIYCTCIYIYIYTYCIYIYTYLYTHGSPRTQTVRPHENW